MVPRTIDVDDNDTVITINAMRVGKKALFAGGGVLVVMLGIPFVILLIFGYAAALFYILSAIFPANRHGENVFAAMGSIVGTLIAVVLCSILIGIMFMKDE